MKIVPNRLDRGFFRYQQEFEEKALEVLRSGWYILGKEVEQFEKEFAEYTGSAYCVGLASGLDALWLAFKVLGIGEGDEVIVPANTYIASVMGITINGATPVFVEPDAFYNMDTNALEDCLTERTKAVLVVHLYGQASKMDDIVAFCKKYDLRLVEDCAQSHGACYDGKMTGTFGDIGCFSFYPSKNLGGFGDGGAIVTEDEKIAADMKMYRNYGSRKRYYNEVVGANSRLDELQAGLLRVKVKHMPELLANRDKIAQSYLKGIHNDLIKLPEICEHCKHTWYQFVVQVDDQEKFREFLKERGVATDIAWQTPPYLQPALARLGYKKGDFPITEKLCSSIVSLPMMDYMPEEEIEKVIAEVNAYEG